MSNFFPMFRHRRTQLTNDGLGSGFGVGSKHSPIMGYESKTVNPHTGFILRYCGLMKKSSIRAIVAAHLNERMAADPNIETNAKLEKKTNSKVGRSTIDRARRAEVGLSIDILESLAKALGMEPWEMIHPNPQSINLGSETVELSEIAQLVTAYGQADEEEQKQILLLAKESAKAASSRRREAARNKS